MSLAPEQLDVVAAMTGDLGLGEPHRITRLPGGRNNRVYRVDTQDRSLFLKHYHRDPDDTRDRLGSEFAFASFAWEYGLRCLAEPLVAEPLYALAVYAFLEGRPVDRTEVDEARIAEAVDFIAALDRHRHTTAAAALPFASEACFSWDDHIATVAARIRRLRRAVEAGVGATTVARLDTVGREVLRRAEERAVSVPTRAVRRCLSPSDFGFHNALVRPDGTLAFYDFEYAGWDDLAKLVCDFVAQVEVPLPRNSLSRVMTQLSQSLGWDVVDRQRVELLLTVYRVKWCCIVLNDLLPDAARRRRFAMATGGDDANHVEGQLQLAEAMLDDIESDELGLR